MRNVTRKKQHSRHSAKDQTLSREVRLATNLEPPWPFRQNLADRAIATGGFLTIFAKKTTKNFNSLFLGPKNKWDRARG